jgi:hypothetical protein
VPSSYQAGPQQVFTGGQWAAIAKSIDRPEIPPKAKQEICDALFDFAIDNIKPEELGRFIDHARKFRVEASHIQNFIKDLSWHNKIEKLNEDIYQLQKFVDQALGRRDKPKGGRPRDDARYTLVLRLGIIYESITGKKPGRSENPETGESTGPFVRFVDKIFELQGISRTGLKHVIAEVSRNAKNPP